MIAVILAGGRGERFKPLTNKIPKPMIQVGNKPILEYSIDWCKKNEIKNIIICLNYLSNPIKKYFGNGKKFDVKIAYNEKEHGNPLGTAGPIANLKNKINSTFIVSYGDIIQNMNFKKLLNFHKKNKGIATICVYKNTK